MINIFIKGYRKHFWSNVKFGRYIPFTIGNNCGIFTRNFGLDPFLIEIVNNAQIANGVRFYSHGPTRLFREKNPTLDLFHKIKLGNDV